jgi:myo-inositol 2-dehydrogenase / D-chiro-inositol 1-dehydrogenase
MRQPTNLTRPGRSNRRTFLGRSLRTTLGTSLGLTAATSPALLPAGGFFSGGDDLLRVGLIGCGGRGTGAALQAAAADPGVRITAVGDLFADQLDSSCRMLATGIPAQFDCPTERRFIGADAYRSVIEAGIDVVLLAAPPHVRPLHVEAAVRAGKHLYCEKPVAIDAPGARRVADACRLARAARLSIVSGLCFRRDAATVEAVARIHDGGIGRPVAARACAEIGLPWRRPAAAGRAGRIADEWQLRNWISFQRFSGGAFVEHHIHAIDRAVWALGDDVPVSAVGRWLPAHPDAWSLGDCLAGVSATYAFADGRSLEAACRRAERPASEVGPYRIEETVIGTVATCDLLRPLPSPSGTGAGSRAGRGSFVNPYQAGMSDLVRAARTGAHVDDGPVMCRSTMVAIMGREAAESGRRVTWEEIAGSGSRLA